MNILGLLKLNALWILKGFLIIHPSHQLGVLQSASIGFLMTTCRLHTKELAITLQGHLRVERKAWPGVGHREKETARLQ